MACGDPPTPPGYTNLDPAYWDIFDSSTSESKVPVRFDEKISYMCPNKMRFNDSYTDFEVRMICKSTGIDTWEYQFEAISDWPTCVES